MPRGPRKHSDSYYDVFEEVLRLMDDQAGKPFDVTNYKIQFPKAAAQCDIPSGCYLAHFGIVKDMVAKRLPKMKPRQPSLI